MRELLNRLEEAAEVMVTEPYLEKIIKEIDASNAPTAARLLQSLLRSLKNGGIAAFPAAELAEYLRERGTDDDEVALVMATKVRAPRAKKTVSFTDAFILFGRETGTSVVPDMRFESNDQAGQAVMDWMAGVKRLKPAAKRIWGQAVKKVHLGAPRGTEDASWENGGRINLTVNRTADPVVRATQITHELGHAFDEIHHLSGGSPWGSPPYASEYAEDRPHVEDVPESFQLYVYDPAALKRKCPKKYEAIKKLL
jgi:hypothetical protein